MLEEKELQINNSYIFTQNILIQRFEQIKGRYYGFLFFFLNVLERF